MMQECRKNTNSLLCRSTTWKKEVNQHCVNIKVIELEIVIAWSVVKWEACFRWTWHERQKYLHRHLYREFFINWCVLPALDKALMESWGAMNIKSCIKMIRLILPIFLYGFDERKVIDRAAWTELSVFTTSQHDFIKCQIWVQKCLASIFLSKGKSLLLIIMMMFLLLALSL